MAPLPEGWALDARDGLPDALRILVEEMPREIWEGHHNFGQMVQFWMQRHLMFRQILAAMQEDATARANGDMAPEAYAPRLQHLGSTLLNELHTHHNVEDHHYFPQLVTLDARVAQGFDLLEQDHHAMDGLIEGMAQSANALLQGGDMGVFQDRLTRFGALLERHLTDEEEIIVPVILHSGFDG